MHVQWFFTLWVLLGNSWLSASVPAFDTLGDNGISEQGAQILNFVCDPLSAEGTAVLCFPPSQVQGQDFGTPTNCSEFSVPGTIASYSCRNLKGAVYTGFLNCGRSGIWTISLQHANNSLCNLDSSIINFQMPDVMIVTDMPEFTTPAPNKELMQPDVTFLSGYEALALQLHNTFRRNHGVPLVGMSEHLNAVAQQFVDSIISGGDIKDAQATFKLNPVHSTMNVEMNWYFQIPTSPNAEEAVSNAVQSWYSGFLNYNWENVENSLQVGDALAFARIIWKTTQFIGVGVASSDSFTFVTCVYLPGRNIASTDPVREFQLNVPTFRIGK